MKAAVPLSFLSFWFGYFCISNVALAFQSALPVRSNRQLHQLLPTVSSSNRSSVLSLAATKSKTATAPTWSSRNNNKPSPPSLALVQEFIQAANDRNIQVLLQMLNDDCVVDDYAFYEPITGKDAIEQRFLLQWSYQHSTTTAHKNTANTIKVDKQLAQDNAVAILFHYTNNNESDNYNNNGSNQPVRGIAVFDIHPVQNTIQRITWCTESSIKTGQVGLNVLTAAGKVIEMIGKKDKTHYDQNNNNDEDKLSIQNPPQSMTSTKSVPELYFQGWNQRNKNLKSTTLEMAMKRVVDMYFAQDVIYDDTAFPQPFTSKSQLQAHLITCANAFPDTFTFQVDKVINNDDDGDQVVLQWHVENNNNNNNGDEGNNMLPFTRGISFYTVNNNKQIQSGIDFVEPGPIKPENVSFLLSVLTSEPMRWIPLAMWLAYMYIVFFSDGILPGANALALETRTWEEVRDLSLNFFLVAPLLHLPLSPTVHPMLEGVFNLLLSWAALFAGFFSDDRHDKPNFPMKMIPTVIGMQFLTSAFLLPYLALRSSEPRTNVTMNELNPITRPISESRLFAPALGMVGLGSMVWAAIGRYDQFGGLEERWSTFIDLLSIDRVGASFLVDLAIFALFQGWLIDDDLKRRGIADTSNVWIANFGKYVPFFGMIAYFALRPPLATNKQN